MPLVLRQGLTRLPLLLVLTILVHALTAEGVITALKLVFNFMVFPIGISKSMVIRQERTTLDVVVEEATVSEAEGEAADTLTELTMLNFNRKQRCPIFLVLVKKHGQQSLIC